MARPATKKALREFTLDRMFRETEDVIREM